MNSSPSVSNARMSKFSAVTMSVARRSLGSMRSSSRP